MPVAPDGCYPLHITPSDNERVEPHEILNLHSPASPSTHAVTQTAWLHFRDVLTIIFTCHLISDIFFFKFGPKYQLCTSEDAQSFLWLNLDSPSKSSVESFVPS